MSEVEQGQPVCEHRECEDCNDEPIDPSYDLQYCGVHNEFISHHDCDKPVP